MKKHIKYALLLAITLLSAPQAFACFTVYNRANQIVYNAQTPPVDMRYQIHEVLPAVYPGGHMLFGMDPQCPVVNTTYIREVSASGADMRVTPRGGALRPKPYRN